MLDIKKLKILREETGISFSMCKKALEETNNNIENAKKLLSTWSAEKVTDKAGKPTLQGAIFGYVHHNKKVASMIELLCETDFVANNSDFAKLGQEIAMQVASIKTEKLEDLLNQEYIRDSSKKISDLIKDSVVKFGENIKLNRFIRWQLGE